LYLSGAKSLDFPLDFLSGRDSDFLEFFPEFSDALELFPEFRGELERSGLI
jgi:hypothetical protein